MDTYGKLKYTINQIYKNTTSLNEKKFLIVFAKQILNRTDNLQEHER